MTPSDDLSRILALPVQPDLPVDWIVQEVSDTLRLRPDAPTLLPEQALALYWAMNLPHPYAPAVHQGVGGGKTLISLLLPTVYGAKRPVLMIPPGLEQSTREQFEFWQPFYPVVMPDVLTYSALSGPTGETKLTTLRPDLLILDEAHMLANLTSARTKRFIRVLKAHPNARVVPMSGTLFRATPDRYSHLLEAALLERSPAPLTGDLVKSLTVVLSEKGEPDQTDDGRMAAIRHWAQEENSHKAMQRRLATAPGVVISTSSTCDASLHLRLHRLDPPPHVEAALKRLDETWELPCGDPVVDAARMAQHRQNLSLGFYYRWDEQPSDEWLDARREWSRQLRIICLYRDQQGFDTMATVRNTLETQGWARRTYPEAWWALQEWKRFEGVPEPRTSAVWLDEGRWALDVVEALLSHQASPRARGGSPGPLLWVQSGALGRRLAEAGWDVRGAGAPQPHGEAAVLHMRRFAQGFRLHMYQESAILEPPLDPVLWQQMLGRLHRKGQTADQVVWDIAQIGWVQRVQLDRATNLARAEQDSTSEPQKLAFATREWVEHTPQRKARTRDKT